MARRRPLPEELPGQHIRLVEELRLLKDRSGLNLAQLAGKTSYSATSWYRYLAGRTVPPWDAVDALGRLAQADRGRLRVLWESAVTAARQPPREPGSEEPGAHPGGGGARPGPSPLAGRAVGVGLAGLLALALVLLGLWAGDDGTETSTAVPPGAPPGAPDWPWPLNTASDPASDPASNTASDPASGVSRPPPGAPCLGDGCRGRDPYRLGCDRGSVPVHRLTAFEHTLTLWYSGACRAVWAEVAPGRGTSGLTVRTDREALTARAGESCTGMLGSEPGRARGSAAVAGRQLGVSSRTTWVAGQ
jgi:hypothetical protein